MTTSKEDDPNLEIQAEAEILRVIGEIADLEMVEGRVDKILIPMLEIMGFSFVRDVGPVNNTCALFVAINKYRNYIDKELKESKLGGRRAGDYQSVQFKLQILRQSLRVHIKVTKGELYWNEKFERLYNSLFPREDQIVESSRHRN